MLNFISYLREAWESDEATAQKYADAAKKHEAKANETKHKLTKHSSMLGAAQAHRRAGEFHNWNGNKEKAAEHFAKSEHWKTKAADYHKSVRWGNAHIANHPDAYEA